MSFADAEAALDTAIEADNSGTPLTPSVPVEQASVAPTTPEGTTVPQVQPAPTPARDEFGRFIAPAPAEPAPAVDTFDGGQFNPDLLPPELQPGWKQLQAAYTQKTQQLSEERKQFEGMDPAVAREAVELYTALQDPTYLQQFHTELTTALQQQGLTPAQASAEAAQALEDASLQERGSVSDQLSALKNDPELAPVADAYSQLRQELDAMKAERVQEREAQEMAHLQMAMAGELVRQESVLRENNFTQKDIDRVHELSPFYDGNLLQAAQAYRTMQQEMIADFVAQKGTAAPGVGPVPGSVTPSVVPTRIESTEDGLKAALAHLAASGIDTLE